MQEKIKKFLGKTKKTTTTTLKTVSDTTEQKFPKVYAYMFKHKKKLYWIVPVVLLLGYFVFKPKSIDLNTITVVPVETKTLTSTVKASGKVTSQVDLELSFKKSDLVDSVLVSVGQTVKKGQILATLKNQTELGGVIQARGSLARVLEGASTEEERVAEVLLENAQKDLVNTKRQQEKNIENAYRTLLSSSLQAIPNTSLYFATVSNPAVLGTYTGSQEGTYRIEVYTSSGGYGFYVTGLNTTSGSVSATSPTLIGHGLSLQFPTDFNLGSNSVWNITVPNKNGALYTTNLNTYESVKTTAESLISSAQSIVSQREAELALKKAKPRNGDVLTAEGQLQNALGIYEGTVIRAPADGVVTKVSIKPGELAKALESSIVIQDVSKLYVEANINESNITTILAGQPVSFTIDAFGSTRVFSGTVIQVDLAPTVADGIVNYVVRASLDDTDPLIKSGMNANLTITTGTKENVLAIPGASITKVDDQQIVKKITDVKKKKFVEVSVSTGIMGDGNMTEITSGLTTGDSVALIEAK